MTFFWTLGIRGTAVAEKGANMKLKRIKYKHITPKSQTEWTEMSLDLGGGFKQVLKALARVIEKYFGLLYLSISRHVLI